MNAVLPNFLIVGAQRCGTTTLDNFLRYHPDIYLSPIRKELNYFVDLMNGEKKDILNYSRYYPNWTGQKAVGDISPLYLFYYKAIAPLIKEYLPDARIVISLRNPVKRAYSSYCYTLATGREWQSFDMAMRRPARNRCILDYRDTSLYASAIKEYLNQFARNQILFILFEDLVGNPDLVLSELCAFIGVDSCVSSPQNISENFKKINTAGYPKYPLINKLRGYFTNHCIVHNKLRFIPNILEALPDLPVRKDYPPLPQDTYEYWLDYYRSDIEEVSRITGLNCEEWFSS